VRDLRPVLAAALAIAGCSRPLAPARLSLTEPPAPEEVEARVTLDHASCAPSLAFVFPGAGQLCMGKTEQAALMGSVGAAEVGAAIAGAVATRDSEHPAVEVPLNAFADLWLFGVFDVVLTRQRAAAELYAPRDTPSDLLAAPLNVQVMKRPSVWIGLTLALAAAVGVTIVSAGDDDVDTDQVGDDPNLFGKRVDAAYGYPLGFAAGAGLFSQVALAEESIFRGYVQSALSRAWGENAGWIASGLMFGAAHIPNALALPEEDRADYLLYGLPVVTAVGLYMGWLYRHSDYSLAPSVAMHFWYDFLLTSTSLVFDPEDSFFSAGIAVPF
jgi:membrane protease YdiL (CAAX protease family)